MFIKRSLLLLLGLSILYEDIFAQLCQGSLGDPVVNITFGSGPNTGAALSSSITNYNYRSADCPDDGYYTIANSTANCFGNTWLTVSEDHTQGDNNGYMMLVNASFTAGDFYVQEVSGLCGGTTYEFAAWLINVIRPVAACPCNAIRSNITFNIETITGEILQTYSTGDIDATSSTAWKQYGLFFTTPAGTSTVMLRITNNAPGGCGNDLALDDITFRPCGPQLTSMITGNTSSVATICEGTARLFSFTCTVSPGYNNPSFQWQQSNDGNTWTDISAATTTSLTQNFTSTAAPGYYHYRLTA